MPSPQSTPAPQRAERADRIPDAEWEKHRDTIKSWYIDQGMRLEDLVRRMGEEMAFKASEQQYKIQFNKWNLRKNKRRLDQRAASPELEHPRRPHPQFRSNDGHPQFGNPNAQLGDPSGINLGAMVMGIPPSFLQPFGAEPFSTLATNPNFLNFPSYGAQYTPGYLQPSQASLHRSPLQQLNEQLGVQSSSQTPQGHFQFNHHNIGDAGGVPPQTSARLSSGTSTTAACPAWLPIHSAVYSGSLRGTKLLLDAKPECAHALGRDNISPAWFAAQGGYADILRLLIAHRVDLNVPDSKGNRFPIHQAAEGGHTRVVEMLLQNGADPDPVDRLHGITPFWIAAQGGHHEIVEMILSHSNSAGNEVMIEIESTDRGLRPIHQAADGGHLKTVQLLRAKGVDCDPVDARGVTPLWIASQKGHADVVHELLNAGAQVDASPYEESRLPIHEAARAGHLAVVQALLEFGADATPEADTFDDSVPSPFLLACAGGNLELVLLFLHYGVDINATGKGKETAIHFAAFRGHAEVAQLLIGKGCDSDACNDKGWTPLMFAAQGGHLPLVNLLIQNHANVNAEDKDSITALCLASQNGHAGTVRRLVEVGALHLPTKDTGRRPIHQAALHGHLQCVKLLLEHSPGEINMADRDGYNALNLASGADAPAQFSVMRYLLRQGAKVM